MVATERCSECGKLLPADAPGGVCPRCLLRAGLDPTVGLAEAGTEELEPGTQFGSYRIVRLLGRGGMGAVYEAEHAERGHRVALKVLNHQLQSPEHRQRFLREGRLAASVNHPHNVYIYGTEEIAGTPVIAMELAAGGTLQERVSREGPLPIAEAVDLILAVISGLQAAHAAGVLHRDVKPSNCFLDAGGEVKVGDFGLSISTALRGQTNLTQSGVFLGTPAFSSPEQLRGDELDVRSDIYSVGVTLYYLLTGKPPFEAKQMVPLLATVLERPAPSPSSIRAEIPAGLARIILRCLAKQPGQRYRDYGELREALLPYSSAAPTPATLGFRVLAIALDFVVLEVVAALLPLLWVRDIGHWQQHSDVLGTPVPQSSAALNWLSAVGAVTILLYFGVLEGIWGATAGKAICRLRVIRADREPPGIPRALLRAVTFVAGGWSSWWLLYALNPEFAVRVFAGDVSTPWAAAAALLCELLFLLPLITMRRHNGYAGLHELVSGTRVVRLPARQARPALPLPDEPLPETESQARIGPYEVLAPLASADDHEMLLAYDTRLLRRVWVRKCAANSPPIAPELRQLARIGRLRWLNGSRDGDCWDAYEAPSGKPLLQLLHMPQPWDAVRFWLLDLARELSACRADGTCLRVLTLDRVWITKEGRAKLLDFPAPGLQEKQLHASRDTSARSLASDARFLKCVAVAALAGHVPSADKVAARPAQLRLPLPARELLNRLEIGEGQPSSERQPLPLKQLELLTRKPASVSPQRRLGALAACWLLPIMMAVTFVLLGANEKRYLREHPEVGQLAGYITYYGRLDETDAEQAVLREAIETVIASQFRKLINDPQVWEDPTAESFVSTEQQRLLQTIVRQQRPPSPEDVARARQQIEPAWDEIWFASWSLQDYPYASSPLVVLLGSIAMLLGAFVVLPSLVCCLLLGDTPLLRSLEIAVVNRDGEPASRGRAFLRSLLLWGFVLLGLGALVLLAYWGRGRLGSLLIVYWISLLFTSARGPHDTLAGTWLVPR